MFLGVGTNTHPNPNASIHNFCMMKRSSLYPPITAYYMKAHDHMYTHQHYKRHGCIDSRHGVNKPYGDHHSGNRGNDPIY